jgi:hypothetical protein
MPSLASYPWCGGTLAKVGPNYRAGGSGTRFATNHEHWAA